MNVRRIAWSAGVLLVATQAHATTISPVPLFLTGTVKPNIILGIDDSGSMDSEVIFPTNDGAFWWNTANKSFTGLDRNDASSPGTINFNLNGNADGTWKKYVYLFPNGLNTSSEKGRRLNGDSTNDHYAIPPIPAYAYTRSPDYNSAYFNPSETYLPWQSYSAKTFGNVNPKAAPADPVLAIATNTINLTTEISSAAENYLFRMQPGMVLPKGSHYQKDGTWVEASSDISIASAAGYAIRYFPATYYRKHGTPDPTGNIKIQMNAGKAPDDPAGDCPTYCSLDRYEIRSENFDSPDAYDAAIQNFANWFTYYRKRHLGMRAGVGLAFANLSQTRIASFAINNLPASLAMQDFETTKDDFYGKVYNYVNSGGTPLRQALDYIGKQYIRTDAGAPITNACQKNFGILFTDGFANNTGFTSTNDDGDKGVPYADTATGTMADIAMSFYATPLRSDFPKGKVATDPGDPNPDLHMVTYGVGLGIKGTVYGVDAAATADPFKYPPAWPAIELLKTNRHPAAVDDLWHATLNGRGQMLNANSPVEVADRLKAVLQSIDKKVSSAAAIATNSTRLDTDTLIYQARFNSADWSGQLLAYKLNKDGSLADANLATAETDPQWDAGTKMPGPAARHIYTYTTAGMEFVAANLGSTLPLLDASKDAATNALLLDYLRGDVSQEKQNGGSFRNRSRVLGDIINSDPYYAGAQNFGYGILPTADTSTTEGSEGSLYTAYLNAKKTKTRMLYVGANDGMLHAFNADTGTEKFAYIPKAVYSSLSALASPDYTHRYFVDGSPFVGDAYTATPGDTTVKWRSILLGTTGAGGRSVFALDVSDPDSFDASRVMWEFTDADLGYTLGQPVIVRLDNGTWVAMFGNGYQSAAGCAMLYLVRLDTGALYKKISTEVCGGNGLSTPAAYDGGDRITDTAYAGDLLGNVWKFNLNTSGGGSLSVAYSASGKPAPLFKATGPGGAAQPITGPLEIGSPPPAGKVGVMVYFGTGRYFATDDGASTEVQSLYGVLDDGSKAGDRSNLQVQTIDHEASHAFGTDTYKVRTVSKTIVDYKSKRGWYMDLVPPGGSAQGERVISTPLLRHKRVIFTTLVPSSDPCEFGGSSWLMELDAVNGSALDYAVFDLNNDNLFNTGDDVALSGSTSKQKVSGVQLDQGISDNPAVISAGDKEYKISSGTKGGISVVKEKSGGNTGRTSWRQIMNQ